MTDEPRAREPIDDSVYGKSSIDTDSLPTWRQCKDAIAQGRASRGIVVAAKRKADAGAELFGKEGVE